MRHVRCAVLGAGGFIGTNLCRHLAGEGAPVRAFGRSQRFPGALGGMPWITGTLRDENALARAVEGCDVVFHLISGSTPATANENMVRDLDDNVVGSLRLLELCRAGGIGRVVFVSSGGTVYGAPGSLPIPETAPTHPICAYGVSKLMIEKYLTLYSHLHGIDHRVLRVSNPFGPYQIARKAQGVVAAFLSKAMNDEPIELWGDGQSVRDYIYIDDVCTALTRAARHTGPGRLFNIGSGIGRNLLQIIEDIERVVGRPLAVKRLPARHVDVPANVLDISAARDDLGWAPEVEWMEGLRLSRDWLARSQAGSLPQRNVRNMESVL